MERLVTVRMVCVYSADLNTCHTFKDKGGKRFQLKANKSYYSILIWYLCIWSFWCSCLNPVLNLYFLSAFTLKCVLSADETRRVFFNQRCLTSCCSGWVRLCCQGEETQTLESVWVLLLTGSDASDHSVCYQRARTCAWTLLMLLSPKQYHSLHMVLLSLLLTYSVILP